jgi:hypothetical protein
MYSQVDQQAARLLKQPITPPETGDLCYAPVDQRVIRKVRLNDLAQRAYFNMGDAAAADQRAAQVAFHTALDAYIDGAVEREMDNIPMGRKASMIDELPQTHTQDRRPVDYAAERDAFIHQE